MVTIEDLLSINGAAILKPNNLSVSLKQNDKTNESKFTFLSATEPYYQHDSGHVSVHHFCTQTTLSQLPFPAQVLSRQLHTKQATEQLNSEDKCKEEQLINRIEEFNAGGTASLQAQSKSTNELNTVYVPSKHSQRVFVKTDDLCKSSVIGNDSNSKDFLHSKEEYNTIPNLNWHGDTAYVISGESMDITKNPFK